MSLALLWAVLFHSAVTYAHGTTQVAQSSTVSITQADPAGRDNTLTGLQSGKLYLAQEGTTSLLTLSLQPSAPDTKSFHIRFSSLQAIPPYSARAPGDNFFCQFYYTSSQPQAP
ncbi:hypothetical protein [Pontibacter sp. HSC-36F09]|uniref:hypothetical protein n=1 Tax=Pontibacter sp. HSC-36F09 TaxID=2910966 RepID=UPI0020A03B8C|nr:hypothetical protein [Pontibacter sp. HSC-36F09]MCP2044302.1 hypothetical protein [Pontibacter sp. HSC-36F09]